MTPQEMVADYRGVETPCRACNGWGVRLYGSTSTWRGGAGGASVTRDVCSACWGSGDANRHWLNLRELRKEQRAWEAKQAIEWWCRELGFYSSMYRQGLLDLAELAEKQSRKRRLPPGVDAFWYPRIWEGMAKMIRRVAEESPYDQS